MLVRWSALPRLLQYTGFHSGRDALRSNSQSRIKRLTGNARMGTPRIALRCVAIITCGVSVTSFNGVDYLRKKSLF
jgi:hypothetical protein